MLCTYVNSFKALFNFAIKFSELTDQNTQASLVTCDLKTNQKSVLIHLEIFLTCHR